MNFRFTRKYTATVVIDANIEAVWQTLTNLSDYHLWNPFTPKIETTWRVGSKVQLTVQMKKNRKPILQTEYLTRFSPPHEMAWGMNWGILLKAERVQRITELPEEKTQYFTEDVIEGLLAPVVHWRYGRSIQKGFEEVAEALKGWFAR